MSNLWVTTLDFWSPIPSVASGIWIPKSLTSDFLYRTLNSRFTKADLGFPIPPIKSPISKFWELLPDSHIWFLIYGFLFIPWLQISDLRNLWVLVFVPRVPDIWSLAFGFVVLDIWIWISCIFHILDVQLLKSQIPDFWSPTPDIGSLMSDLWLLIPDFKIQGTRVSLFPFS